MLMMHSDTPIEKYSTYKARMFRKRMSKLDTLLLGIDALSLKQKDKDILKKKMFDRIKSILKT